MENRDGLVTELSAQQCWERLGTQQLGRIVTWVRDVVEIFPVNYAVEDGGVVFRTAEGSKLFEISINDQVLFEVDDHTETDAWSVIIRGRARRLESDDEVLHADTLPLKPWIPTLKHNYVRIDAESIDGRAFPRDEEPSREGPQSFPS